MIFLIFFPQQYLFLSLLISPFTINIFSLIQRLYSYQQSPSREKNIMVSIFIIFEYTA